jgi:replicative DNA helicase
VNPVTTYCPTCDSEDCRCDVVTLIRAAERGESNTREVGNAPTEPTKDAEETGSVGSVGFVGGVKHWEKPLPLTQLPDLAPFPTAALPAFVRDHVEAKARHTQTPADVAGCIALSVLGTIWGGRARVAVDSDWHEPLNIWVAVLLNSGERKSPVFSSVTAPLYEAEMELYEDVKPKIREATQRKKIAEEARDNTLRRAGKEEDRLIRAGLEDDAIALAQKVDEIEVPPRPRLQADDATPEAVAKLLARSPHSAIGIHSDEGDIFDLMGGRYSRNGQANLGIFLKGHVGTTYTRDRGSGEEELIERPAITMGLAVQPQVPYGILRNTPEMREKGVIPRFLWSSPVTNQGHRDNRTGDIPPSVVATYRKRIKGFASSAYKSETVRTIKLSPEARERLHQFMDILETQLGEGGRLEFMRDWANKLPGATVRIAGLLHCAEEYEGEISRATFDRAIYLANYFLNHTMKMFTEAELDPVVRRAGAILRWIERNRQDGFSRWRELNGEIVFTQRDLHQSLNGTFRRATDLDEPLRLLVEHDYIRRVPVETKPTGRKPSPHYQINPELRGTPTEPAKERVRA